jgi:hypothetical protein
MGRRAKLAPEQGWRHFDNVRQSAREWVSWSAERHDRAGRVLLSIDLDSRRSWARHDGSCPRDQPRWKSLDARGGRCA